MTTTATHDGHDTTPERVLLVAFELSEKTWKLGVLWTVAYDKEEGCSDGRGIPSQPRTE